MSNPETTNKQRPGWYWVQDMRNAARPVWWTGSAYFDSPTARDSLSWHWPSFRMLAPCREPDELAIKAHANAG